MKGKKIMFRDENSIFFTEGVGGFHHETVHRPAKQSVVRKEAEELRRLSNAIPDTYPAYKACMAERARKQEAKLSKCPQCHKVKRTYKKISSEKIREYTLMKIEEAKSKNKLFITAEDIAHQLGVKVHYVKQVFQKLNIEGVLHKPEHHIPHDSNRDPMCNGYYSGWAADIYYLRKDTETEDG